MRCLILVPAVLLGIAAAASAQPVERGWITFNVGATAGAKAFNDTVQTPLYQETETIQAGYPGGGGVGIAGAGGVNVWRQLTVGVGVTSFSHTGDATIAAAVPHPFFDNRPRAISGSARATHDETSIDIKAGFLVPLSPTVRLLLTAGPSIVHVKQTIVTGVTYSEAYPYDTAQFTGAATQAVTHSDTGFNAGADLFWLFSAHVGAGGTIQVTRATVKLPAHGGTVSLDAGGVLGGGGIRFVF